MTSTRVPPGVEVYIDASFCFEFGESGEASPGLRVAYETFGKVDAPLVVVLGGISAGAHVASHSASRGAGWWEGFVGPGAAVDTEVFRVLGIDWLGGGAGSSGPEAASGAALAGPVTSRDQARALASLVKSLGYESVHAIVGSSYGGMVGLAFAEESPALLDRLVCLCAAHRSDPWTTASRALARRVLRLGLAGRRTFESAVFEREALSIARGLGMLSYRTRAEFENRFERGFVVTSEDAVDEGLGPRARFEVEDYLEARGSDFASRFDAAAVHTLSESIDLHELDPAAIAVPTYLAAARSDQLVRFEIVRELSRGLACLASFTEIESQFGHDAFLKEREQVGSIVRSALEDPSPRARSSEGGVR